MNREIRTKKETSGTAKRKLLLLFISVGILYAYVYSTNPPKDFPIGKTIRIEEGMTLSAASAYLQEESVIRSSSVFNLIVTFKGDEEGILAGVYQFDTPLTIWQVAERLTGGEYDLIPVRITIPEGLTVREMADIVGNKLPLFNSEAFIAKAEGMEGYLFPDTYFFLPNYTEDEVIADMKSTFEKRIEELKDEIAAFGRPLEEVVIMASILEEEARTTETRRMISGILWKRIKIDMPLQVDAVFPYINGKNTYELTSADLEIDSLYNTYKYKGLPIGPISNPGLDSLRAAVTPEESPYFYYLSDREGNMYYAETLEGHKRNKALHL